MTDGRWNVLVFVEKIRGPGVIVTAAQEYRESIQCCNMASAFHTWSIVVVAGGRVWRAL